MSAIFVGRDEVETPMTAANHHLRDHVEIIAKHEEEFLAGRTPSERIGDWFGRFIGSVGFIATHLLIFTAWILFNTLPLWGFHPFDPTPFSLLDTIVALEAIFLASFIVMRQGRLSRRSDEREHLMLQMLILAEKEITAVLNLQQEMARKSGFADVAGNSEIAQLSAATSIDEMAQTIREALPSE